MISKEWARALGIAALAVTSIYGTQYLFGDIPARWVAVAILVIAVLDLIRKGSWVRPSGYWVTRGTDSEVGEPCWLVKGGPFADEDDTIAELGTWREARAYVRRSERLLMEGYKRSQAEG